MIDSTIRGRPGALCGPAQQGTAPLGVRHWSFLFGGLQFASGSALAGGCLGFCVALATGEGFDALAIEVVEETGDGEDDAMGASVAEDLAVEADVFGTVAAVGEGVFAGADDVTPGPGFAGSLGGGEGEHDITDGATMAIKRVAK